MGLDILHTKKYRILSTENGVRLDPAEPNHVTLLSQLCVTLHKTPFFIKGPHSFSMELPFHFISQYLYTIVIINMITLLF